ncbi:UNVERIFIED_CONTAM: UBP1-associated protein 2A [Sesamum radiatum]|uniref:UBP1-associated protein 2A n=1 Tax=Sesamum radiatum TaxID=300843 RepID=A0AAW2UU10_SESRA
MARKRKSRVTEAPQEPELAQPSEPEPEPVPEPAPEPEPEQPQPEETPQTLEEDQEMGGEVVEEEEEEEERQGDGEGEEEGDEVEEQTDDAVATDLEKNEGEGKITENPSENAAAENGDGAEGQNEEGGDELEEEPLEKLLEPFSKDQLTLLIKEAVSKHPDILENVHKLADADPAHCKIFVRAGLGGELRDDYFCVWEWPLFSAPPVSEYTQRKIYVSNVSAELDPKKLLEFFSKFGEIEEGPLGLDKQTGKPRGFCLFVYKSLESAKKALEEPHKNFEGQILHCQKAIDGPKHSKGYFNQQHGPAVPSVGFNPAVAPAAIGQAVAALLATQGAGLGIGNLLGGIGAGVNPQGVPPMMNNAGYGGQGGAGGYGGQPGMQGGYGGQPQMGQGGVRPHQGGAPYMGHGH